MTQSPPQSQAKSKTQGRTARLQAALRDNLRRRKHAQTSASVMRAPPVGEDDPSQQPQN